MNARAIRLILFFSLFIIYFFFLFVRYHPVPMARLTEEQVNKDFVPLGELVQGVFFEQAIRADFLLKSSEDVRQDSVCLEILLANYSNRKNRGDFLLGIVVDDNLFEVIVDASRVRDNIYHRVCFEALQVGTLLDAFDKRLVIRGLSSLPGASVTAWTTLDQRAGSLVSSDSQWNSRSLVFVLTTRALSAEHKRNALILLILNASALALAISPLLLQLRFKNSQFAWFFR